MIAVSGDAWAGVAATVGVAVVGGVWAVVRSYAKSLREAIDDKAGGLGRSIDGVRDNVEVVGAKVDDARERVARIEGHLGFAMPAPVPPIAPREARREVVERTATNGD